jgi:hypothetical protein
MLFVVSFVFSFSLAPSRSGVFRPSRSIVGGPAVRAASYPARRRDPIMEISEIDGQDHFNDFISTKQPSEELAIELAGLKTSYSNLLAAEKGDNPEEVREAALTYAEAVFSE